MGRSVIDRRARKVKDGTEPAISFAKFGLDPHQAPATDLHRVVLHELHQSLIGVEGLLASHGSINGLVFECHEDGSGHLAAHDDLAARRGTRAESPVVILSPGGPGFSETIDIRCR
ncbi:MAG: hypothetical protein EBY49_01325 [Actinobacteria bacterium]|nr:hypothetical protein [Actinomycetota bacterium]